MPSLQVVDTTENKPDPTGVEQFFSNLGKNYKDESDRVEIGNLLSQYKQNRGDANAWEDLQLGLETSNISPSKRLETQKRLNDIKIVVMERDKALNSRVKEQQEQSKRERNRKSLEEAGATQQQLNLYDAASVGGETKIMADILDDIARNKTPLGLLGKNLEDFDKGLTPRERVDRQEKRYTTQTPLVNKNSESLNGLESEERSIELLSELDKSGRVGEGIHNLNINPFEGSLIIPKLATAEEQLFVKTVNDFTVKAKDSFGARVTNFELDRFMQRLPTLANSQEGRRLILRQMNIVNKINQLEKRAIQKVFDKYGVRNIDYSEAENMARREINDEKESLRKEFLDLESVARKEEMETINNVKSKVKEGYTAMRKPDGTIKQFPIKNVPNLEEKGYKRL